MDPIQSSISRFFTSWPQNKPEIYPIFFLNHVFLAKFHSFAPLFIPTVWLIIIKKLKLSKVSENRNKQVLARHNMSVHPSQKVNFCHGWKLWIFMRFSFYHSICNDLKRRLQSFYEIFWLNNPMSFIVSERWIFVTLFVTGGRTFFGTQFPGNCV